jgi:hypothetical protein
MIRTSPEGIFFQFRILFTFAPSWERKNTIDHRRGIPVLSDLFSTTIISDSIFDCHARKAHNLPLLGEREVSATIVPSLFSFSSTI